MSEQLVIEGARGFYLPSQLSVIEEEKEVAWAGARDHITIRSDTAWTVGNFVSADARGNTNGHVFGLDELRSAHKTIPNTPLNMGHRSQYTVGFFKASELLYPEAATAAETAVEPLASPYVEALAAMWKAVYPDEFRLLQDAHRSGSAWFSMEAIPKSLTCMVDGGCGKTFPYQGVQSSSYCDCLNQPRSKKLLNEPLFVGGALVLPPMRPGWKRADITEIAQLISRHATEADEIMHAVAGTAPELDDDTVQQLMEMLMAGAFADEPFFAAEKHFTKERRAKMAELKMAMPDGSFPILTVSDLKKRINSYGRAKPANAAGVKEHLTRWARILQRTDLLPKAWKETAADELPFLFDFDAYEKESASHYFSADERKKLASEGKALPDGSWPIYDEDTLKSALVAFQFHGSPAVKAWIMKRAKALNLTSLLPKTWTSAAATLQADMQSGVIVCLEPSDEVSTALAAIGTVPAEELHVTLAYLGDVGDLGVTLADGTTAEVVAAAVAAFCAGARPIPEASLSGLGRFALPDGTECTYASVDSPGLNELRDRLVAALEAADIAVDHTHGFTPHIAIAYTPPGEGPTTMPGSLSWSIDELDLWWAGERSDFDLLGGAVAAADVPDSVAAYVANLIERAKSFGANREKELVKALECFSADVLVADMPAPPDEASGDCPLCAHPAEDHGPDGCGVEGCDCSADQDTVGQMQMMMQSDRAAAVAEGVIAPFADANPDPIMPKPPGGRFDGMTMRKDDKGVYVHTHRARSKSYPTPHDIPDAVIKFIRSSG